MAGGTRAVDSRDRRLGGSTLSGGNRSRQFRTRWGELYFADVNRQHPGWCRAGGRPQPRTGDFKIASSRYHDFPVLPSISLTEARRIALAAQGFDRPRPSRATARHLGDTIRRLGLLQIDCVNVVCAAHYMVPFSRVGAYDRAALEKLVYRSGQFAEHWAHEISIVPVETWPLLRYRRETDRV